MGCWNGTCMISNLPIMYGDKVKLIILRKSIAASRLDNTSAYVYSTDIFTPSFFPLTGTYDDYGMIENVEQDWNYELIEKYFKELFGEKIITDRVSEPITNWTLIDVLSGIERGNLKYYGKPTKEDLQRQAMAVEAYKVYSKQGFSSEKCKKDWEDLVNMDITEDWRQPKFSFIMIREDIWNNIINNYKGEFYNQEAKSVDDPHFYLNTREWCTQQFEKGLGLVLKMKKLFEADKDKDVIKELKQLLSTGLALNIFTRQNLTNFLEPALYDEVVVNGDKETRNDVLERFIEITAISAFLSETRKGWMIQAGAGSQHDGWKTHLILAEKIVDICKEKIAENEEEENEE